MTGKVAGIFIASNAGEPMQEIQKVGAIAQLGLEGDRYTGARGTSSVLKYGGINHVSLIEQEAILRIKEQFGVKFPPMFTRRNILTEGVSLNLRDNL